MMLHLVMPQFTVYSQVILVQKNVQYLVRYLCMRAIENKGYEPAPGETISSVDETCYLEGI